MVWTSLPLHTPRPHRHFRCNRTEKVLVGTDIVNVLVVVADLRSRKAGNAGTAEEGNRTPPAAVLPCSAGQLLRNSDGPDGGEGGGISQRPVRPARAAGSELDWQQNKWDFMC